MSVKAVNLFEFVKGGLINDVDVTFTNCKFINWDRADGAVNFHVQFAVDGEDDPHDEYYSVGGKQEDWTISEDELSLIPSGAKTAINERSKYAMLVASLLEKGWKPARADASAFNGIKAHMIRITPKWEGFEAAKDSQGRDRTVLVVQSLKSAGSGKVGRAAAPAAAKSAPAAAAAASAPAVQETAAASDGSYSTKSIEVLNKIVTTAGILPTADATKIKVAIFKATGGSMDSKTREGVVADINRMVQDSDWLLENGYEPTDGGIKVMEG